MADINTFVTQLSTSGFEIKNVSFAHAPLKNLTTAFAAWIDGKVPPTDLQEQEAGTPTWRTAILASIANCKQNVNDIQKRITDNVFIKQSTALIGDSITNALKIDSVLLRYYNYSFAFVVLNALFLIANVTMFTKLESFTDDVFTPGTADFGFFTKLINGNSVSSMAMYGGDKIPKEVEKVQNTLKTHVDIDAQTDKQITSNIQASAWDLVTKAHLISKKLKLVQGAYVTYSKIVDRISQLTSKVDAMGVLEVDAQLKTSIDQLLAKINTIDTVKEADLTPAYASYGGSAARKKTTKRAPKKRASKK